jgi:DNA primase
MDAALSAKSIYMPGIDYTKLREQISIEQVLQLAGFVAIESSGDERRGPCLIHGSSSPTSRSFSANLRKQTFVCFKCGAAGNQLDLWVAISKLPLYDAARDLCERLAMEVPEIRRW